MKVTLTYQDKTYSGSIPYAHAKHVEIDDLAACLHCKLTAPVKVHGKGREVESRDTYAAKAETLCCGKPIGILRVKVSTIFGIEEDERIQSGQYGRVY